MANTQLYRCTEDDCLWVGVNPEELSDPTGMYSAAVCPVCDGFADLVDEDAPTPQQGKAGLN